VWIPGASHGPGPDDKGVRIVVGQARKALLPADEGLRRASIRSCVAVPRP